MRPLKIMLEGFLGFATQGKLKITLDLSSLGDAKLVALAGPNGAGKTTLMDNLHPFRVMPSRWNSPTPGGGSYWDQVQQGDARKEFEFEHQGALYRSLLTFRSTAKTKKAEAYLFRLDGEAWVPAKTQSGVESDGKTDTYDAVLEGVLGKSEVFFHSVFSAQSRTPLSDMSAGEVKSLLSGMLGHDALREQSARASKVASLLGASLTTLQSAARSRDTDRDASAQAKRRLSEAVEGLANAEADITRRESALTAAIDALTQAQVKASGEQALVTQRKVLTAQIAQIRVDGESVVTRMERDGATALRALTERLAMEQSSMSALRADMARANEQVRRSDQQLSAESAIRQAVADVSNMDREVEDLVARKAALDAPVKAALSASAELATIAQQMGQAQANGKSIADRVAQIRETSDIMSNVPCGGTEMQSRCPLLGKAREAKAGLAPMESTLHDMRASYRQLVTRHEQASKAADDGRQIQTKADELQRQIDALSKRRQQAAALSAQLAGLDRERQVKQEALERSTKAQTSIVEADMAIQSIQGQISRERERQSSDVAVARAQTEARLKQVQTALADLPQAQAVEALQQAETAVTQERQGLSIAKSTRERIAAEVAAQRTVVDQTTALEDQSRKASENAQALSDEIANWTLLAKALGNDGLIALSIDDAGPEIAARCNALLEECYGGRFAVSIETQKSTASGEVRETLEIWVDDTARGQRKPLGFLSGGEGVWVNESLVRGLALYIATRSGNSYGTLFTDEADGALDPERKRQFMRMKRTVIEQGGFEREYFISHTPDLLEMADARIDVTTL